MYIVVSITILLLVFGWLLLRHPMFGKLPSGERLEKIRKAPNYQNGTFQNQSVTPNFTEGESLFSVMKDFFLRPRIRISPTDIIPSEKTDLLNLDTSRDILVWFGHSSYFIQIDGKRILVDPVFCGHASPFSFSVKAFKGSNNYSAEDIPEIDYLFISHDHWDHLDYTTIKKLRTKVKQVICGLGTGAHLEHWGYQPNQIIEKNWHEQIALDNGFNVYTVPTRHFSGRGFKRNQSLWMSYVLQTPSMKIFIGGDSGYDKHFTEIGKTFGEIDLAILENGQYDKNWKYIHLMPYEIVKAAKEIKTKRLLTVHHSKFALANHTWDDPLIKISESCKSNNVELITPKIGEQVNIKDNNQTFGEWWKNLN